MIGSLSIGAGLAAVIGAGKTISTNKRADTYNLEATEMINKAKDNLDSAKKITIKCLEQYGLLKTNVLNGSINKFVHIFLNIKNVNYKEINENVNFEHEFNELGLYELKNMRDKAMHIVEEAGSGVDTDVLVELGTYGIASLLKDKSNDKLGIALENLSNAQEVSEKLNEAIDQTIVVTRKAIMQYCFLSELDSSLYQMVKKMKVLTMEKGYDYLNYDSDDKKFLNKIVSIVRTIKSMFNLTILSYDGVNSEGEYNLPVWGKDDFEVYDDEIMHEYAEKDLNSLKVIKDKSKSYVKNYTLIFYPGNVELLYNERYKYASNYLINDKVRKVVNDNISKIIYKLNRIKKKNIFELKKGNKELILIANYSELNDTGKYIYENTYLLDETFGDKYKISYKNEFDKFCYNWKKTMVTEFIDFYEKETENKKRFFKLALLIAISQENGHDILENIVYLTMLLSVDSSEYKKIILELVETLKLFGEIPVNTVEKKEMINDAANKTNNRVDITKNNNYSIADLISCAEKFHNEGKYSSEADLYKKAAQLGDIQSMIKVGNMYAHGIGTIKDNKKAIEYFELAKKSGSNEAYYYLGNLYETAGGEIKDIGRAIQYYINAAEFGNIRAQERIGTIYLEQRKYINPQEAFYWTKKAAKRKNSLALMNLSIMYQQGIGVAADYEKSRLAKLGVVDNEEPQRMNRSGFKKQVDKKEYQQRDNIVEIKRENTSINYNDKNPSNISIADELIKLKQLLDNGVITENEFSIIKKRLIQL